MPPPVISKSNVGHASPTGRVSGQSAPHVARTGGGGGGGGGGGKVAASGPSSGVHNTSGSPVTPRAAKMGNGASAAAVVVDGESLDLVKIKMLIPELRNELKCKDAEIRALDNRVREQTQLLAERNDEIIRLKEEVHKLRSVLQLKVSNDLGKADVLTTIPEDNTLGTSSELRSKKQGVSAESSNQDQATAVELKHHEKDIKSKQLIKDAILGNDFLKNLESTQVREIVDCMYEKKIKQGHYIIKEGDTGQHLYVSAEGELEVSKGDQVLGRMSTGRAFGELAILYNCTRTASVKAITDVKVWVLDRNLYQVIMMKTGIQRREENIAFLRSVPLLKDLPREKLAKIADCMEIDFFPEGEYIIREGATGDSFFIINKGEVKVTQKIQGHAHPQEIRRLKRGDYFGEKALLSEDRRTANVIALNPGVECLTVDRESFTQLIGSLHELRNKDYGDEARRAQRLKRPPMRLPPLSSTPVQLSPRRPSKM